MKTTHRQNSPERRVTARFDGHVQGVGFRYTTVHLAAELSVRGFVQNEIDGSVTVVAEGPEDGFIRQVPVWSDEGCRA